MGKKKDFPLLDAELTMNRKQSEDFKTAAMTLDLFIKGLPISPDDNNQLVDLIIDQIKIAEYEAYIYGSVKRLLFPSAWEYEQET